MLIANRIQPGLHCTDVMTGKCQASETQWLYKSQAVGIAKTVLKFKEPAFRNLETNREVAINI